MDPMGCGQRRGGEGAGGSVTAAGQGRSQGSRRRVFPECVSLSHHRVERSAEVRGQRPAVLISQAEG